MTYAREESTKLLVNVVADIWRFPWWWYTSGVKFIGEWCMMRMHETWERLAIGLFFRYFFKPMYGDYTISGRAISLAMRFVLIIYKLVRLAFWAIWYTAIFIAWMVLLPVTLLFIFI
ncbi:MAG: hypothetical protein ABIJ81_04285 [Patescibacteria group bacterium]